MQSHQDCITVLVDAGAVTSYDIYSSVAVLMQSRWRGGRARQVFAEVKKQHKAELAAANVLTRAFTGFVERKRFVKQKTAAVTIQQNFRRYSQLKETRKETAAVTIQKHFRGYLSRMTTHKLMHASRARKRKQLYQSSDAYQSQIKAGQKKEEEKKRAAAALKMVQFVARMKALAEGNKLKRAASAAANFSKKNKKRYSISVQNSSSKEKERQRMKDDMQDALVRRGRRQLHRLTVAIEIHRDKNSEAKGLKPKAGIADRTLRNVGRHMQQFWDQQVGLGE